MSQLKRTLQTEIDAWNHINYVKIVEYEGSNVAEIVCVYCLDLAGELDADFMKELESE